MTVRRFFLLGLIFNFTLSLYLFLQQGVSSGVSLPHFDKVGHFIAFFALAICFHLGTRIKAVFALLLLLAYGVAIEFAQSHIPGREASLADILADMAGALCYYAFAAKSQFLTKLGKR